MKYNSYMCRLLAFVLVICLVAALVPSTSMAATKKPRLNIKKLEITVGSSFQLRLYNMKKKYKTIFSSTDEQIVSIDESLKSNKCVTLIANATGTAVIKVSVKKGKRVIKNMRCRVKVSPNAMSIKFTKKNLVLEVDEQIRLETIIKPISSTEQPVYESDDLEVATVSSKGVVTAVSPGIVTITATLLSTNLTATCTIVVEESADETQYPDYMQKSSEHLDSSDALLGFVLLHGHDAGSADY